MENNRWVNLELITKPCYDFIKDFCDGLLKLKTHSFIAKEQSEHLDTMKKNLAVGEILVICDFTENYSFVIQDEIQGYHWSNEQATVHPFVCYYREIENGELKCVSYVVISECLTHDVVAVYLFQKKLMEFLHTKIEHITRVIFFSDGCGGQYKNKKKIINMCFYQADFGTDVEWNFFATSHGKGKKYLN